MDDDTMDGNLLQKLIKHIHNALSLEHVSFSHTAVRLIDMEDLHVSLPKLKTVALDSIIYSYSNDNLPNMNGISSKPLGLFLMQDFVGNDDEPMTDVICNWISYVGAAYKNLKELCWIYGNVGEDIEVDETVLHKALTSIITKLKQINSIHINLCILSKSLLKTMDENNIQLKKLSLEIRQDSVEETFQSLCSAKSINALKSLEIYSHIELSERESLTASAGFGSFCTNLKSLTHLTIENVSLDMPVLVIVDILRNVLTLENLMIHWLMVYGREDYINDGELFTKLHVVVPGQLKSLSFDHFAFLRGSNGIMKKCNLLFEFILKSCPLIEKFKLHCYGYTRGVFSLDFRENDQLKRIDIRMGNCRYDDIHHYFGKIWKNIGKPILEEHISEKDQKDFPYYMNLAWMDSKNIKAKLLIAK